MNMLSTLYHIHGVFNPVPPYLSSFSYRTKFAHYGDITTRTLKVSSSWWTRTTEIVSMQVTGREEYYHSRALVQQCYPLICFYAHQTLNQNIICFLLEVSINIILCPCHIPLHFAIQPVSSHTVPWASTILSIALPLMLCVRIEESYDLAYCMWDHFCVCVCGLEKQYSP